MSTGAWQPGFASADRTGQNERSNNRTRRARFTLECQAGAADAVEEDDTGTRTVDSRGLRQRAQRASECAMEENLVKQKIRRGEPTIGTWLSLPA